MSERAPQNHEHFEGLDELRNEIEHALPEHAEKQPSKAEHNPSKELAAARHEIDKAAKSEKQHDPVEKFNHEQKANKAPSHGHINQDLKKVTLQRELTQIRRHLSAPERTLSKVIHQPVVRAVSEVSGKTISRPSGLLGGGILAFTGTTGYLLLAKNQGFKYNYAVFLALFAGGFVLGLILELIVWTALRSRHQAKFH